MKFLGLHGHDWKESKREVQEIQVYQEPIYNACECSTPIKRRHIITLVFKHCYCGKKKITTLVAHCK